MPLFASDYGYRTSVSSTCIVCGAQSPFCCDGTGKRLSFKAWGKAVDAEICRIEGTERNEIEAPYAEMYAEGMSVEQAIEAAYK